MKKHLIDNPRNMIAFTYENTYYMFDSTWLGSTWECIYGKGCKTIGANADAERDVGCCEIGAHFSGKEDVADTKAHVDRLTEDLWHNMAAGVATKKKSSWLRKTDDGDLATTLHNGACIFHNPAGTDTPAGCALHAAALAAGERPMDWKPDVCWQVPIYLNTEDDYKGNEVIVIRDWQHRDWGGTHDSMEWWCTESPEAYTAKTPVYVRLKEELVELVGPRVYEIICNLIEKDSRGVPVADPFVKKAKITP